MTFAKLHDSVLEDKRLSKSARELYARISRRCINTESWKTSQAELAANMDITDRHLRRLIKQLVTCRHIHIERGGDGQPATYSLAKMSGLKCSDRTKMSGLNSPPKPAKSSPAKPSTKQVAPPIELSYINKRRRLEGESAERGNRWPENAAAKFEKLIGQPPDAGFTNLNPEIAVDNLELLEYKLARGARIDHRAGWLAEAIRSNYAGQAHKQFKTSRQRAAEEKSATNAQLAKRREVEAWERKQADDQAFYQQAREIFAALDGSLKSRIDQAAREVIGVNLPRDPKLRIRAVSVASWQIFIDLLKNRQPKHGLSPDILAPYREKIKQRFGPGNGTRPPPSSKKILDKITILEHE